jgi:hypothetical protein
MIAAGVSALQDCDLQDDPYAEIVEWVLSAVFSLKGCIGHAQMSHNNPVGQNGVSDAVMPEGFKCNAGYAIPISVVARPVEIEEWSVRACNGACVSLAGRDCLDLKQFLGFIGHDGFPWLWNAKEECWRSVKESSLVSASCEPA